MPNAANPSTFPPASDGEGRPVADRASTWLVIHGHFYQPPREDPWTDEVPEQPEAAPFHDWNERITAECYRPVTEVPVTGADGDERTVNLFDHLSWNVGPTLLSWLAQHHADLYERIVDSDRRTGRGIAQGYGHAILPLCDDRDLRTQVRWGVADFRHRFGRAPDGMWMPETAVSERVLAVLAEEGIRFTIVAPTQIRAVRPLEGEDGWRDVAGEHGEPLDAFGLDRPYRWCHPARPDLFLDLVVYEGDLAQQLAFGSPSSEDLLRWVLDRAGADGGLVAAATDGETFGHHRHGAERDLAHALTVAAPAAGVAVPRLLDLLDDEPATHQAVVRTSAWSCAHGVGRWMYDCGCHTGGRPGWTQEWRGPLRNALDRLRDWAGTVMDSRGVELLGDPWLARDAYGDVVVGARTYEDFAAQHVVEDGGEDQARLLLEAQRFGLLMYTSCGWFFNDLAGIETVQILQYAARSMDLYREMGIEPPVAAFLAELGRARSNDPAAGDGRRIWAERVDAARPAT
jgi:alpha-amylase/alpha-mannosidase (GH57 family)